MKRLQSVLAEARLDVLLVTSGPNVRYLCGFTGSAAALVVTEAGKWFFTDGRYTEQAREEVKGARITISSRKTAMTVLDESRLPVLNSHSNAKALLDVVRNLDDDYIEKIKENRGVFGFIFAGEMISLERPDISGLVKHIMYVYKRFGANNMAIGTDYFGLGDNGAPPGLEDITRVRDLWGALLDAGMKESDIEKVSYKNALRVIEANAARWKPFA